MHVFTSPCREDNFFAGAQREFFREERLSSLFHPQYMLAWSELALDWRILKRFHVVPQIVY
jgi:hypothetical protein